MTPKEFLAEAKRQGKSKEETKRVFMELKKSGAFSNTPRVDPNAEAPSGLVRGAMDPIHGSAQLLHNVLPDSITKKVNQFNNWLVDKGVPLARIPEWEKGGLNAMIAEDERKYQEARAKAGETGFDGDRLVGNIVSPANLVPAARFSKAASMAPAGLKALGTSATFGGAMGATNPVYNAGDFNQNESDYWEQKALQTGTGAVMNPAMNKITSKVGDVIQPRVSQAVNTLKREGINPSWGQTLGGWAQQAEDKLTSIPFLGDFIIGRRADAMTDFNRAVFNRVLSPIKKKLPDDINMGREAYSYVHDLVENEYNKLLPQLRGELDDMFVDSLNSIKRMSKSYSMDEKYSNKLIDFIDNEVIGKFTKYGKASGQTLKDIESKLGKEVRDFMASSDVYERRYGEAMREIQAQLRAMLGRANPPNKAAQLAKTNKAYANLKVVQDAASRRGSKEGIFTPAQLGGAVSKATKSKAQYSKGRGLMQDLADSAEAVMGSKVPTSGTSERLMAGLGVAGSIGAYGLDPTLGMASAASMLPWSKPGNAFMNALTTKRPNSFTPIANAVRSASPYVGGASAAPLSNQLIDQMGWYNY